MWVIDPLANQHGMTAMDAYMPAANRIRIVVPVPTIPLSSGAGHRVKITLLFEGGKAARGLQVRPPSERTPRVDSGRRRTGPPYRARRIGSAAPYAACVG